MSVLSSRLAHGDLHQFRSQTILIASLSSRATSVSFARSAAVNGYERCESNLLRTFDLCINAATASTGVFGTAKRRVIRFLHRNSIVSDQVGETFSSLMGEITSRAAAGSNPSNGTVDLASSYQ